MLTRFALRLAGRTALRSSFCRSLATSSSTDGDAKTGRPWTDLFSTAAPTKLVKRKLNENVKTIEDDIRHAIFQACAMRESNFEDLGKIDWARSSRTDKGVHAGCIVFSGKLLIDEENKMDPVSGRVNGHKEALNASLPENIRVFSCTRVSKRFPARKNCVLREYTRCVWVDAGARETAQKATCGSDGVGAYQVLRVGTDRGQSATRGSIVSMVSRRTSMWYTRSFRTERALKNLPLIRRTKSACSYTDVVEQVHP
ncbi:hypothetical protein PC115_g22134 [Phytophthora cactorum]|uniref:Uncharacterized protein n=1 Tax=Phytophthora cactorum TaxID=29920 RepID=A0A8T1AKI5_9STRA|nr:hypothetical protein PC115_g22134 [Phytophthora cactorum]